MSDLAAAMVRINLAAAAAVILVLVLRPLMRRLFGARTAYALWLLVPVAALAMVIPPRVITVREPARMDAAVETAAPTTAGEPTSERPLSEPPAPPFPWLPTIWAAGLAVSAGWFSISQGRFNRALRAGQAGPAVLGVVNPRIVVPDDFKQRYTPREQQLILAHERRHIRAQDPRINAVVAAARCLAWFNPLLHLLGHFLRIDQELACDAAVIAAHPGMRRTYAEAMLKTQLAMRPLPLGCYWPAAAARPLALRIGLLAQPQPAQARLLAGGALLACLAAALAGAAWGARPAVIRSVPPPPLVIRPPAPTEPVKAPIVVREVRDVAQAPMARAPARPLEPPPPLPPPPPQALAPLPPLPAVAPPEHVRRIWSAARRSAVQPGQAVRVIARMTDHDGHRLVTDLTAFGSQSEFRTGFFERSGSPNSIFTAVEQRGDELLVTVSLDRRFAPETTGTIALAPGHTGLLQLPSGESVTVTALTRPETAEEAQAPAAQRLWDEQNRLRDARFRTLEDDRRRMWDEQRTAFERRVRLIRQPADPFRCGRGGAIC